MIQRKLLAEGRTVFFVLSGPKGAVSFDLRLIKNMTVIPMLFTHRPLQPYEDQGPLCDEVHSPCCKVIAGPCASTEPRGSTFPYNILHQVIETQSFDPIWDLLEHIYVNDLDEPVET